MKNKFSSNNLIEIIEKLSKTSFIYDGRFCQFLGYLSNKLKFLNYFLRAIILLSKYYF